MRYVQLSILRLLWIWFGSGVAAGIIGHARQAAIAGAVLGLFLGPIGVVAAFALDGRASCPHCAGRLDGRGQICQHCHRPIRWDNVPSELIDPAAEMVPLGQGRFALSPLCRGADRRGRPLSKMWRQHHLGPGDAAEGLSARQPRNADGPAVRKAVEPVPRHAVMYRAYSVCRLAAAHGACRIQFQTISTPRVPAPGRRSSLPYSRFHTTGGSCCRECPRFAAARA